MSEEVRAVAEGDGSRSQGRTGMQSSQVQDARQTQTDPREVQAESPLYSFGFVCAQAFIQLSVSEAIALANRLWAAVYTFDLAVHL